METTGSRPMCIAHRGFSTRFPENTIAAFDAAVQEPIDAMELDIQLTKDRVPVIYHDRTLHMIGGGFKRIHRLTLEDLEQFDFGGWFGPEFANTRIATLEQVLERYGARCPLMLEIKARESSLPRLHDLVKRVLDLVRQKQLVERVYLFSFELPLLQHGHELAPDIRFVLNQKRPCFLPEARFLYGYSCDIRRVEPSYVQSVHDVEKPVFTYTCLTEAHYRRARASGVDGILANNPRWLKRLLDEEASN